MNPVFQIFLIPLALSLFGLQTQAQDCSLEAVATLTTQMWGSEISFTLSDDNGPILTEEYFENYSIFTTTFCLDSVSGCLILEMNDSFGDGWNGAFLEISIPALGLPLGTFTLEEGSTEAVSFGVDCETETVEIEGCTDPTAFNYDPTATIDDGSCSYDCECEDTYDPVCGYDLNSGNYTTYNNPCEAECAQAWVLYEGTCEEQPVYGCTDENALNFDPEATIDDGSCIADVECNENQFLVLAQLTTEMWGGEVSFTISNDNGVLVEGYGNADYATTEVYFCLDDTTSCLVLNMIDSFGDGWNGATLEVTVPDAELDLGVFELEAGNFQAVSFGLDCEIEIIEVTGCTDPSAFNYDPFATVDDGSCDYDCGCEDAEDLPVCAFNHITGEYMTFPNACEAECVGAWVLADGDCSELPVYGCTDVEALNYDAEATDDDGSCVFAVECGEDQMTALATLQTALWGSEVSFVLSDADGIIAEGQGWENYETTSFSFCLSDTAGCLQLDMIDSFGDGWNGATLEVSIPELGVSLGTFSLELGSHQAIEFGLECETTIIETEGCTDPYAFNYDPYATVDDGSCSYDCECEDIYDPVCGYDWMTGEYVTFNNACEASCAQAYIVWDGDCADQPIYGCTDEEAVNYNPDATQDDGSCVTIPTCESNETFIAIEVLPADSLSEWGNSVYWNLTDSEGLHVTLVYDYSQWQATNAYGCLEDGCYNFFLYDYGWSEGNSEVQITLGDVTTTYDLPDGTYEAAFAIGVNTEGCEVFIPIYGCMDPEAMNYNPDANMDDGYCLYPCECEEIYDPVCAYDSFTGDYVTFNNACEAECWNAWIVWDGDCADQPIYGCTDPEALNYNPEATNDDGTCAFIPVCGENETEIIIQTTASDSLNEWGGFVSLHWSLTTDLGQHINLVYDYSEYATTSYGCVADGCYNFYLSDFGWSPGSEFAEVILNGEVTTYSVATGDYTTTFALGVNTEGCEVTIPGCTDPEALNYYADATIDDGSCQYPFICETGEVGYVYLYTSVLGTSVDIVSDAGEVVFSDEDLFGFGGIYGEVCLEPGACYTAIIQGEMDSDPEWNDGLFGVTTTFEDLAYEIWPVGENLWAVQFGLDGTCANMEWTSYVGCTDELAINYNPEALIDDGSCIAASACDGMFEVEFVLNGGLDPDEVGLRVSNEAGDLLMDMDGYTGSSVGCVPAGCYTVEMLDSSGDGWNGGMAELYVDGEPAGTMTLEEGGYEVQVIGLDTDCETPDNGTSNVMEAGDQDWTLEVFPNPGTDQLTIRSSLALSDVSSEVIVFNADGRNVKDLRYTPQGMAGDWLMDATGWPAGMYIVHVSQNGVTQRIPWIKLR